MDNVIGMLLDSGEPSVRYKVMVNVLGYDAETAVCQQQRQGIKTSPRAQKLLSEWDEEGDMPPALIGNGWARIGCWPIWPTSAIHREG